MSRTAHKLISASGGEGAYEIDQSLLCSEGDGSKLRRTPSSAGNRKTFTFSTWCKRSNFGLGGSGALVYDALFGAYNAGSSDDSEYFFFGFNNNDYLTIGGWTVNWKRTNRKFRDPAAWHHIMLQVDTTQATADNRFKMYVDGVQETSFETSTNPSQNLDLAVNATYPQAISDVAYDAGTGPYHFDGYMAETHLFDGAVVAASEFGETNSDTGQWIPKKYTGTASYGTNGYYMKYVSGAIGTDSSGQSNNYTTTNLANSDVVLDTPTNNFSTLNSVMGNAATGLTLSQGNLKAAQASLTSETAKAYSTMSFVSGKWYVEVSCSAANVTSGHGVVNVSQSVEGFDFDSSTNNVSVFTYGALIYKNGSQTQSGLNSTAGGSNILGIALDLDNGTVQFYSNGSTSGSAETLTRNDGDLFVFCDAADSGGYASTSAYEWNYGQNGTHCGTKTAGGNTDGNGIGNYLYSVPSGFLAPCTSNLPEPAVKKPSEHFNTVLYTGNSSSQNITGVGFQPDLVWLKNRNEAGGYPNLVYDALRGVNNALRFDDTGVETDRTGDGVSAFLSDGFTLPGGGWESNAGGSYVSWNWKANGTGGSNSDGSITCTTSANTTAGFSMVYHATDGYYGGTYGHGLGKTPAFMIVRDVDNVNQFYVWHQSYGNQTHDYGLFNDDAAITTGGSASWGSPSSTTIQLDQGLTRKGISYVWAEIEGFSKFGSYTGNGAANGPFINCGFKPAFVIFRPIANGNYWLIIDNKRDPFNDDAPQRLYSNVTDAETTYSQTKVDFLSNGFKIHGTYGDTNVSGGTILYMAWAESPFKYANAR